MTRRIMRSFKLSEISAVDNPAQAHAKATIIKRAEGEEQYWKKDFTAEERRQLAAEGKAKPDGSYPIVTRGDLANAIHAWGRGGATASDKEWIIRRAKALDATDALPDGWLSKSQEKMEDMTTEELNKAIAEAVAKATADLSKQLKDANDAIAKIGAKNKTLPQADDEPDADDDTKKAWRAWSDKRVAKALEDATATLAKVADTDEVIKVGDVEFKKSQTDEATFRVIKAQAAEIAKERDARELGDFAKRADGEFGSLPGESVAKAKMLRAASKLDEADRKVLETALKAGNAALKAGFAEIGKGGVAPDGDSAEGKLDALANEYAKKHDLTYEAAYSKVLALPEGKELYKQFRADRPRVSAVPN